MTMLSRGYKGRGSGGRNVAASGIEALSSRASTGRPKKLQGMPSTVSGTKAIYKQRGKEEAAKARYLKKASAQPPAKKATVKKAAPKKSATPKPSTPKPKAERAPRAKKTAATQPSSPMGLSDTSHLPPVKLDSASKSSKGKQFDGAA